MTSAAAQRTRLIPASHARSDANFTAAVEHHPFPIEAPFAARIASAVS